MDIQNHIYSIKTPQGRANAFRLGGTNYLLTTDAILVNASHFEVYNANHETCSSSIIVIDTVGGIGILYLHDSVAVDEINYKPELVEDSYDVLSPATFGIKTPLTGYISNFVTNEIGQTIYFHSLSPSSKALGSPLVDNQGDCIGILNTKIEEDEIINYANPIKNYLEMITKYQDLIPIFEKETNKTLPILHRCPKVVNLKLFDSIKNLGCCEDAKDIWHTNLRNGDMEILVSKMLSQLKFDKTKSKFSNFEWQVSSGSAKINIVYLQSRGILLADAMIANQSDTSQSNIYKYLLNQNYILEGLTFSVVDQNIILSMKLYDNYLEFETMLNLFKSLLEKADRLDDIIIQKLKT